jgi:molecular chaperone HtpG
VLLLTDPVDSFWVRTALGFEGKPFKSVSQGEVDFGLIPLADEKKSEDAGDNAVEDDAAVLEAAKQALGDKVADVKASTRLTDSASCLVASAQGRDRELERLLERQNRGSGAKPILELNMKHAMVRALGMAKKEDRAQDVEDLANLLLDEACILDGEIPSDPAAFARRLNDYVVRALRSSATN